MESKNKVAIITGAGTGIGEATKDLLRSRGANVYNLDKEMPADEMSEYYVQCDVRKRSDITTAVHSVYQKTNRIDMLFANAGIHLFGGIEETSDTEFDDVISTNISGTFYMLRAVLPVMKMQQRGSIVLMGSDQSHIGKSRSAVYGLTKGAIGQLTKSTAIDYAAYNIRVNCICPGTIDTPLLHKAVERYHSLTGEDKDGVYKSLAEAQPIRRIAKPQEIAEVVVFLLSDENSFMTGSLISSDGGYVSQ
jgi:NAD(P)-dependent dehydrogenase (short-subunit alcohol dehydrogenase family)